MLNSNEPIKVAQFQKLANQSMLNGALVIEMTYNSFSESKENLGRLISKDRFNRQKTRDMGSEKYISTRFRVTAKLIRSAKEQRKLLMFRSDFRK